MIQTIAVADVGGTHARFALAEVGDGRVISLGEPVTFNTRDYSSFEIAWQEFGRVVKAGLPPALGMAFAGPVGGELLKLTNSPWVIHRPLLEERLGVVQSKIVNDFGAVAHAVAQFDASCFDPLCGPDDPLPGTGVITVVGPGTGLGVAQLHKSAHGYEVIETEGGHVDFAPLDIFEDQLLAYLRESFGRVSVERIVAGAGLINIYLAMALFEGRAVEDPDEGAIWTAAMQNKDPLASAALDRFFLSLGAVTGDLALAHGSSAVVIAGGLGYRLKDRFGTSGFVDRFLAKGRFEQRMAKIPVKLLNHPQPGLYGAAAAFAQEFR